MSSSDGKVTVAVPCGHVIRDYSWPHFTGVGTALPCGHEMTGFEVRDA